MRPGLSALLALALLSSVPAAALTPLHLVKDINPIPAVAGSDPEGYVAAGGAAFFNANDPPTGYELWRTDGTSAGTFQILDACPGPCSGYPRYVAHSARSYFFAVNGESGRELWVSGGLPANTFRLTGGGIALQETGIWSVWIASQGLLYFVADDGVHGPELWRTDGTRAGTFMAADIAPGRNGSQPSELTEFNGRVFFRAYDGRHGATLWKSDGTAAGTQMVRPPAPSWTGSAPTLLQAVGRTLFFVATSSRGATLWKSDGTAAGTVALTTPRFFELSGFSTLGNRLIFMAWDRAEGQELWVSDGTGAGTRPLTSLPRIYAFYDPDSRYGGLLPLPNFSLGKRFLFRVDDGVHGAELWTTDGTPKGTRMVKDLCPGSCGGAASHLVALGGRVLFTGTDGSHGLEPWSSDGTAAGTRMIRDLCAGDSCSSAPDQWRAGQGKAFFVRRDEGPFPVPQLWSTDGTAPGTARLTSYTGRGLADYNLQGTFLGGAFLFTADDSAFGAEPWISDGTPRGTRLVADVNVTDIGGSRPSDLKSAAGKAYFLADDGLHGRGSLWVSDGTEAGTSFLAAPFAGEDSPYSDPPSITAAIELGGRIFFTLAAHSNSPGTGGDFSLWRSDGTPEGTVRLMAETGGELAVLGDRIFFVANDGIHGWELWVSDGTAAGARMVVDLDPVDQYGGSSPGDFTVFQDRLYFRATTGKTGYELWRTDGTPEGTVLVKGLETPPFAGSVFLLGEFAGRLYFTAPDAHFVYSLWTTDGTDAGTLPLDLTPGPEKLVPTFIVPVGARFFLVGETFSADGTETLDQGLWISDGTAAGTKRLAGDRLRSAALGKPFVFKGEIYFGTSLDGNLWKSDGTDAGTGPVLTHDGQPIVHPFTFQVFAGRLFFTTYSQGWLYETDGTPAGTRKIAELDGDPGSYEFFALAPAGSRLLFRSWDHDHGAELWGLEAE